MYGELPIFDTLAVVPIVVNAGAALFPAILAAITSVAAIILKPKELIRVCKTKPWIPVLVILITGGIWALISLWPSEPNGAAAQRKRSVSATEQTSHGQVVIIDWTKIALARIASQKQAPVPSVVSKPEPSNAVAVETDFIFRAGPRRLGAIGDDLNGKMQKAWHYYPRWIDENGVEQEDTEAMILSSPAFYGNRVYGASCLLYPPDNYGAIFCLDAVTGKQIWSVSQIDGQDIKGFFSSPAVTADGRYLIIGQGLHPDSNCNLICIDTQTGKIHWTLQVSLHIESSPAVDGDFVYVGCGAIEDPSTHKPLSHKGFVLAVRISDGKELWRFDVADPESSPVVQDGRLYIGSGFNGKAVAALDLAADKKDRLLWSRPTSYPITGAVTLIDDLVITGGGNGDFVFRDPDPAGVVLALDKSTGQISWSTEMPDAVLGAVSAGKYLICPVASGEVVALDLKSGDKKWTTSISGHAPVLAACSVTDNFVYAVSQDGYLGKLDLETGNLIEKHYINAADHPGEQGLSISSPLVVQGRLYVGSETGGLSCYIGDINQ